MMNKKSENSTDRTAIPVASAPQTPPPITSASDDLSIMTFGQTFGIPAEFTSEQRIELLHMLRQRNQGLIKDAEFDFQIRREEMKVAQPERHGHGCEFVCMWGSSEHGRATLS